MCYKPLTPAIVRPFLVVLESAQNVTLDSDKVPFQSKLLT